MPSEPPPEALAPTERAHVDAETSAASATDADADELRVGLGAKLGRYDLIRVLGAGGMGVVFEARDPELDRVIAVKVLSAHGNSRVHRGTARLKREAVTMARLAHPNVIHVFDVGIHQDRAFVAMELIRGGTLAAWLTAKPRTVDERIAAFLDAGRGLAAAHAAGVIHRDFKPQNVLVGDDGRVVVTDFGLARDASERTPPLADGSPTPTPLPLPGGALTVTGEVLGTPAYMAPEQRAGGHVDERADQYSYCLALSRALEPAAAQVPRRIRAALARGLAPAPADRFPSMRALLARLEPRRTRARWIAAAAAVVVVVAAAAAIATRDGDPAAPACPAPTARLARVWDPARAAAMRVHLNVVDPAQGSARLAAAERIIEPFVATWRDLAIDACADTRIRHAQPDAMLDRRIACLDRALVELDASIAAVVRAPDRAGVDQATAALAGVGSPAPCADLAALTEQAAPPREPVARREYDAISRELAVIEAGRGIERERADLRTRAGAAVDRARRLAHPILLADALWALAMIEIEAEDDTAAIATLREQIPVASAAHDDDRVAQAWSRLVILLAGPFGDLDEAEAARPVAEAAIVRGGDTPALWARLRLGESRIADHRGDLARARAAVDDGRRRLEPLAATTAEAAELLVLLRMESGRLEAAARDWQAAAATFREVIPLVEAKLGPDHAEVVTASFNLGVALLNLGDAAAALPAFEAAARIGEARLSASPRLVSLLDAVATTLIVLHRPAEAAQMLQRALAMARATMAADDRRLIEPVGALGAALIDLERYAEARPLVQEQIGRLAAAGIVGTKRWADALYNLGYLEGEAGRCRAALAALEPARATYARLEGARSDDVRVTDGVIGPCRRR